VRSAQRHRRRKRFARHCQVPRCLLGHRPRYPRQHPLEPPELRRPWPGCVRRRWRIVPSHHCRYHAPDDRCPDHHRSPDYRHLLSADQHWCYGCVVCSVRRKGLDWCDRLRLRHLQGVRRLLQPVPSLNGAWSVVELDKIPMF
jgi:hypothetical protein